MKLEGWNNCMVICWAVSALAGLLVLIWVIGPTSFIAALLLGVALAALLGLVSTRLFCGASGVTVAKDAAATGAAESDPASAGKASGKAAQNASVGSSETAARAGASAKDVPPDAATGGEAPKAGQVKEKPPAAKAAAAPTPGASKSEGTATPDKGTESAQDSTGEGKRPETLSAPRGGAADDLKQIKGIGPKLEKLCNSLGFYHLDQIANWTDEEVTWVDANLKGFKGRVSRDEWVKQAGILAGGGETEFSKRVDDGDVY